MFLSTSDYLEMVSDLLDGSYLYFNPKDRVIFNLIHLISSYLLDSLIDSNIKEMRYEIHVSFGRLRG